MTSSRFAIAFGLSGFDETISPRFATTERESEFGARHSRIVATAQAAKIAQVKAANKAGAAAAKKNAPARPQYDSFTKELIAVAKQNGVDLDVCFRAFNDQGRDSWGRRSSTHDACRVKCVQLAMTGRDFDPKTSLDSTVFFGPKGDGRRNMQKWADFYKSHPQELQKDMQAFAWMKGATQTILENIDFENNDRANREVLICRTEERDVMSLYGRKKGEMAIMPISTAESSSVFSRVTVFGSETCIYKVPYSRISAIFFMEDDRASSLFLGDGENEVNCDFTNLPCAYVAPQSRVSDMRAEYDRQMAAFRAKKP